jgi:hypothetical protein
MPRGGYRPGSGRKKKLKINGERGKPENSTHKDAITETLTPLEYLLQIMRDVNAEPDRRDRAAISALPYCHARASGGKKAKESERAKSAGAGKFAPSSPPLRLVKRDDRKNP